MSSSHVRIELAPKAGFCVKSSALAPTVLPRTREDPTSAATNLLEPPPGPIVVAKGQKVFINIAWDPKVPPPPEGNEEAIQRAMLGQDADENNLDGWYVPVIVSHAREDMDKAGKPSLVFDCIYNSTVKSRTLHDPEFKVFLIELALQRIEARTGLVLSRTIGTPNISSKGKLLPRTVQIPALSSSSSPTSSKLKSDSPLIQAVSDGTPRTLLVQEVTSSIESKTSESASLPGLRGILKKTASEPGTGSSPNRRADVNGKGKVADRADPDEPLDWSWTKDDAGRLRIEVHVPGLTPVLVQSSTLDVEPRRIILSITGRSLDIDVALSDAEIVASTNIAYSNVPVSSLTSPAPSTDKTKAAQVTAAAETEKEKIEKRKEEATKATLQLKRQRDFAVDTAEAEWRVGSGTVVIYV